MFATMILEPIWQLYDSAITQQDPEKAAKMALKGVRSVHDEMKILKMKIKLEYEMQNKRIIFLFNLR